MRKRSVGINVRVSVTEKRKMTLMAKRCGLSLSEYLRQRALGYEPGGHPPKEVFNVLDKLDEMAESCSVRDGAAINAQTDRLRDIQNEPILYRAYYTLAITTGLRRGELCALQWRDITGACELTVRRSRSCASGQIVESDTKSHRERIVTIPMGIWELLMALRQQQVLHSGVPDREQPIFTDPDGHVPHPDTFTRHLRRLYRQCGLSEDYHLHTLRHFYATYLLQEGTSKQVAASLLGHADTAFLERTYCHPQDVAKQQAAKLMQDLLNNQNPCYVAFMKNKNRKAKKAG